MLSSHLAHVCWAAVAKGCGVCCAGFSAHVMLGPIAGGPVSHVLALWTAGSTLQRHAAGMAWAIRAATHVGVGAVCLAAVLLTARHCEGNLWTGLRALRRRPGPREQDPKSA